MRRLILAAAGLALLVPAALAQTVPTPGAPAGAPASFAGQPGEPGALSGPGLPPPPHGGPRGPGTMPPPPPPSRAAHIHLQRGDTLVDVKCADDDSTKACTDTVTAMLDKLGALPAPAKN